MNRESLSFVLGLVLLSAGAAILLAVLGTVLGLAANPGPFLREQLGGEQASPPTALFAWGSNDTTVAFTDLSSAGSAEIVERRWDFGDGTSSTERDPVHDYPAAGEYLVRLTVRDANGLEAIAAAQVSPIEDGTSGGAAEPVGGLDLDLGQILFPVAVAVLVLGLYIVAVLVGGAFVKAGWNLVRPRPETIRVRIKPKHFQSDATADAVQDTPPAPAPPPPESGSESA